MGYIDYLRHYGHEDVRSCLKLKSHIILTFIPDVISSCPLAVCGLWDGSAVYIGGGIFTGGGTALKQPRYATVFLSIMLL